MFVSLYSLLYKKGLNVFFLFASVDVSVALYFCRSGFFFPPRGYFFHSFLPVSCLSNKLSEKKIMLAPP